jgi:hypothetical protein
MRAHACTHAHTRIPGPCPRHPQPPATHLLLCAAVDSRRATGAAHGARIVARLAAGRQAVAKDAANGCGAPLKGAPHRGPTRATPTRSDATAAPDKARRCTNTEVKQVGGGRGRSCARNAQGTVGAQRGVGWRGVHRKRIQARASAPALLPQSQQQRHKRKVAYTAHTDVGRRCSTRRGQCCPRSLALRRRSREAGVASQHHGTAHCRGGVTRAQCILYLQINSRGGGGTGRGNGAVPLHARPAAQEPTPLFSLGETYCDVTALHCVRRARGHALLPVPALGNGVNGMPQLGGYLPKQRTQLVHAEGNGKHHQNLRVGDDILVAHAPQLPSKHTHRRARQVAQTIANENTNGVAWVHSAPLLAAPTQQSKEGKLYTGTTTKKQGRDKNRTPHKNEL